MANPTLAAFAILSLCLSAVASSACVLAAKRVESSQASPPPAPIPASPKQAPAEKQPSPDQELQQAISNAGNDRAALVRNLEAFLKKHPDSHQRPQIYRALVEASLQLRENARASDYAERIVALSPDDISMTILAIQLIEQTGDEAGLRRAANYATRVLQFVEQRPSSQKSPKISQEEWLAERKRDRISVLALRGKIELKLKDFAAAEKDFAASYAILPSAGAAEQLGEIAELKKDSNAAIQEYARAFALADATAGSSGRRAIRQKLGNVWRMVHGSEEGLGEYLLHAYDEVSQAAGGVKLKKNADMHEPSEFTLRKAPEGTPFSLKQTRGKVLVVNFWATWCGPCRALEPQFAKVAGEFQGIQDVLFLAANCDEDETQVAPYLDLDNPRTTVVFADGLDRLFAVNSYPTVIVIDRDGKIAYRADGFGADSFEQDLAVAVRRSLAVTNPSVSASP